MTGAGGDCIAFLLQGTRPRLPARCVMEADTAIYCHAR